VSYPPFPVGLLTQLLRHAQLGTLFCQSHWCLQSSSSGCSIDLCLLRVLPERAHSSSGAWRRRLGPRTSLKRSATPTNATNRRIMSIAGARIPGHTSRLSHVRMDGKRNGLDEIAARGDGRFRKVRSQPKSFSADIEAQIAKSSCHATVHRRTV